MMERSQAAVDSPNTAGDINGDCEKLQVDVPDKRGWNKFFAYVGPGFLICIAYIDPGNFESDLQAGALFEYELLWVLLLASAGGLFIQSLAANLGVVTGKHLAEHCRSEYPRLVTLLLWVVAELAIVASDIPEVIGTAFALNMLFGLEVWVGVLLTGLSTLLLLALQQYGVRVLEVFIAVLVLLIAVCFMVELGIAAPPVGEVVQGLFVPRFSGRGATGIAISLLGAVVMPHNLFLHSALVLSRKAPRTHEAIKDGCRYNLMESSVALLLAFTINVSVIAVSATVCARTLLAAEDSDSCRNLDLNRAPFLLKNTLGGAASKLFGIALLASGQSSTITGTYAGQYVMQGFLELRYKPWLRNLVTRMVAILPSLAVALVGGSRGAGQLIIISSMILSFELPFALVPLLKFTSSPMKMGPYVNAWMLSWVLWALGLFIVSVNVFYICDSLVAWLSTTNWPIAYLVPLVIVTSTTLLMYIGAIVYLAVRPDVENTFGFVYEEARTADEDSNLGTLTGSTKEIEIGSMSKLGEKAKEEDMRDLLSPRHLDSADVASMHANISPEAAGRDESRG